MFGDSVWFDVTLKKPLGLQLCSGPDGLGSGVGVAEIMAEGGAAELMEEVLAEGAEPAMWVQEGDELVEVEGESTENSLVKAQELIMATTGDTVALTFSRARRGFIKVVFPDGSKITSPRAALLSRLAAKAGYDSGCTCSTGRCGNCWHEDPTTGEVYALPLNVPGIIPSTFRTSDEDGLRPGEGEFESWLPLRLRKAPEAFQRALEEEAEAKARARQRAQESSGGWFW